MIRRLWIRWVLFNNHICPKHGPKRYAPFRYYCPECDIAKPLIKLRKLESLRKEYGYGRF